VLLGLKGKSLGRFESGFARERFPLYDQPRTLGLHCINPNCIVHEPMEAQYVRNKFLVVPSSAAPKLRCVYCEREIDRFVVANKKNRWYASDPSILARTGDAQLRDIVLFADGREAEANGFHVRRPSGESKPASRRAAGRSRG
jgi:hypothetical protein